MLISLMRYAKEVDISYSTAIAHFKAGNIPYKATRKENGKIEVEYTPTDFQLEELAKKRQDKLNIQALSCPDCHQKPVVKKGTSGGRRKQLYQCKSCGITFSEKLSTDLIRADELKPEILKEVITLWNSGFRQKEICVKLNMSERAARAAAVLCGINTKRKRLYSLKEDSFSEIDSPQKAYLLGIISSDGCVTNKNYFALQMNDISPILLLASEIYYTGDIFLKDRKCENHTPSWRINFSSDRFCSDLNFLGIHPKKSEFNEFVLRGKYSSFFLLGYFDGDGCASLRKGGSGGFVSFCGTKDFCYNLKEIYQIGSVAKHSTRNAWYWKLHDRCETQWLYDFMYGKSSIGLRRKKEKFQQILASYRRQMNEDNFREICRRNSGL